MGERFDPRSSGPERALEQSHSDVLGWRRGATSGKERASRKPRVGYRGTPATGWDSVWCAGGARTFSRSRARMSACCLSARSRAASAWVQPLS